MLQPGDAREVQNRISVCHGKVVQINRKLHFARKETAALLAGLGLDAGVSWKMDGIVIIDGFGGAPSAIPNAIPVVPAKVFLAALQLSKSIDRCHAFFCSPLWLPRKDRDFLQPTAETEIWGIKFSTGTLSHGSCSYLRESLPIYFAEAGAWSSEGLRSMAW